MHEFSPFSHQRYFFLGQIENTFGEKFAVEISRQGLMTKFSERAGRHYDFTYNEETGLLTAVTTPGEGNIGCAYSCHD